MTHELHLLDDVVQHKGTGEKAHQLRALAVFVEDSNWFVAPILWFTTNCTSRSMESSAILLILWAHADM